MIRIDYKKELEAASKGMIMIHDPVVLIKLIVRTIVRKLRLRHAAMILYEPHRDCYVLSVSRGEAGFKIPQGFTRFTKESPIIKLFVDDHYKPIIAGKNAIVMQELNKLIWQEGAVPNGNGTKELLHKMDEQMKMLNAIACVPAFYRKNLMAILLLGEKQDSTPFDEEELNFFAALASDTAMAVRNAQLFTNLSKEAKRNRELFIQTIMVLGSTIEAKDVYTHGHTERVTNYAMEIARQMETNGSIKFTKEFYENLYISGLLHDIGKIAVPESILNKTGKLTKDEYETMKTHAARGAEMVKPLNLSKECIDGIRHHHERHDGRGYPDGLTGGELPITAAILAVADAFDAMTSNRSYRKAMSKEEGIKVVKENSGTQFNPIPAKAMLELFKQGKI